MISTFSGYRRVNGDVGVRDVLLALPSVVCATRATARAVENLASAMTVEHPLGCAQIGADREQTMRVLVGVGAHPNVRGTVVVGLGCEGIPAADIAHAIRKRHCRGEVVTIQEAGGTVKAGLRARNLLAEMAAEAPIRQTVSLNHLVLGVGIIEGLGEKGRRIVRGFLDRGGRVIEMIGQGPRLSYGERMSPNRIRAVMGGGAGGSEGMTGLVASGAQIILAQCDAQNVGGHAIAPVIRIGYEPRLRPALQDDMDGLIDDRTAEEWVDWILAVANGELTMAERHGTATFAIQRVGPTL